MCYKLLGLKILNILNEMVSIQFPHSVDLKGKRLFMHLFIYSFITHPCKKDLNNVFLNHFRSQETFVMPDELF